MTLFLLTAIIINAIISLEAITALEKRKLKLLRIISILLYYCEDKLTDELKGHIIELLNDKYN